MDWTDVTSWTGFLVVLVGIAMTIFLIVRRLRWMRNRPPGTSARRLEGSLEIAAQAVLFGGMALMNFGSFAGHVTAGALPRHLWLTLAGGAAMLVLFGVHLGRLLMRWQLRQLGDTLDTRSGEFATRA